jgi:hypothetical protein
VTCSPTGDAILIVNSFYYNLTRSDYNYILHCYTFTRLTISTLEYSHSVRSVWYSLGDCRPLTANCLGRLSCLQDNLSARTTEKTHFPILLRISGNVFIEPLRSNGHVTDPQKTSYVIPYCCLLAVTCLSSRCGAMVTSRTHRKPVM